MKRLRAWWQRQFDDNQYDDNDWDSWPILGKLFLYAMLAVVIVADEAGELKDSFKPMCEQRRRRRQEVQTGGAGR